MLERDDAGAPTEESYAGRHAELYDLLYDGKPYAEEAAFVDRLLRRHGTGERGSLLEIACGTGRHAGLFASFGYDVVATDWSSDMLAQARRKNPGVSFERHDMRALDLANRRFDAAVCLFDSIGYAQTNEAIGDVMRGVHKHLRPRGLFIFEFWHAAAMICRYEPERVRNVSVNGREIVRTSRTRLDIPAQLATVEYTLRETNPDGTFATFHEKQVNRFFLVQEVASMLQCCGFEPIGWHAGFSEADAIDESTWHVLSVARRIS